MSILGSPLSAGFSRIACGAAVAAATLAVGVTPNAVASKVVAGGVRVLRVAGVGGVPVSGVAAVALNVTVTGPEGGGFVTVYPCGTLPLASNLNFVAGQTVPNAVIAPVDVDGAVCFYASVGTHLLADVSGWFPKNPAGFQALVPTRLLDTRNEVPPPLRTFGPGAYRVGVDIAPGTYRTRSSAACYWERLRGFSGELSDIIANDFNNDNLIVTIKSSDLGFRAGSTCPLFTTDLSPITASPTAPFGAGTYQVGIDIAPGTWRGTGNTSCYWKRVQGFSGSLADIIANDFGTANPIVSIKPSDVGFQPTSNCGTWTKFG